MMPSVLNETVLSAKSFLDGEIKGRELKEIMTQRMLSHLFESEKSLTNAQRDGVGETTILKFLAEIKGKEWNEIRSQQMLKPR